MAGSGMFAASDDVALDGYDVVSYFLDTEPKPGAPTHSVIWKGVVWQFETDENRQLFEANPRAYAPQFGGYCAYGVAKGVVVSTDPRVWHIYQGKLYLTRDRKAMQAWIVDVPGNVAEAGARWPEVLAAK
ncbi:YHS domain-containing (seleno)protein [Sedimentitalea xiamensis]|nr:YHS domain-containing (seleno)protein [Sedimentitalea xiamensis]